MPETTPETILPGTEDINCPVFTTALFTTLTAFPIPELTAPTTLLIGLLTPRFIPILGIFVVVLILLPPETALLPLLNPWLALSVFLSVPFLLPTPGPAPVDPKAPTAIDINAAGPDGTAPAKDQTGAAGAALAKTTAAVDQQTTDKAGQTVYAQVKANIDKLDKKGKQRILQLLTKSIAALPVKAAPVKAPAAKPAVGAADPAAPAAVAPAGGAPAPAADTTAAPAAPAADTTAAPAAPAGTTPAAEVPVKKKRAPKKPAAPSQAEIDADRERNMGVTSDSIIRKHVSLAETLMQAIAKEKSRMVAEGKISIFRK